MAEPTPSGWRARLTAWAEFLRLPNLATVPGDPLAGFALASLGREVATGPLVAGLLAASLFYLGGLALNDLLDCEEDRRDRPHRPLPSGRIGGGTAQAVTLLLFAGGLLAAHLAGGRVLAVAAGLVLAILLYHSPLRRLPVLGPVLMGSCRALSFLLGVAAAGLPRPLPPLGGLVTGFEIVLIYIAAVTLLARSETTERPPGLAAGFPAAALLLGLGLLAWQQPPPDLSSRLGFAAAGLTALGQSFGATRAMRAAGRVPPPVIGRLISALVFWQAAQLCAADRLPWALGVALGWPLSRWLARRIAQS
jgi:4-hydroxybenzoate polyprenyltransferase